MTEQKERTEDQDTRNEQPMQQTEAASEVGMTQTVVGVHSRTPFILQKSRMRRRARTDLCGGDP